MYCTQDLFLYVDPNMQSVYHYSRGIKGVTSSPKIGDIRVLIRINKF